MRKFVTFLTTGLLALMCCASIVSAKTNPDVSHTEKRSADATYTVSVMTNGKATNGITEITYNADALVCDETDVVISAEVDLYSVNVEEGVVRISYIAEKAIPAGTFITVSFDVTEAYAEEKVSATVSCVSYDAKGNELTTGPKVEDKSPANSGNSNNHEENENQQPVEDKENAGNKKEPVKREEGKTSEKKDTVVNEETTVEETTVEEQMKQTEKPEQMEEIAEEEVPLAAEAVQTSNTPVLAFVLAAVCVAAVAVIFIVKKKQVE